MKYKYIINPDYEYLRKFIEKVPEAFDHEGVLVYDQRNQVRIFKMNAGRNMKINVGKPKDGESGK